ncbi:hypothetical protein RHD99_07805 [Buttiauxella selenatireducens]|uniref:Uncharacterized protein n=1 Tax=Buttiauxella selenatireducens TaxID=3073902 RepID=A0ABY9SEK5_9ENTR|nr:hypothetical protein [Buttiauxella sp. R73]WMY75834.1 hypothetical protein RHD99_07805 [Buttiauxella sp. R73]
MCKIVITGFANMPLLSMIADGSLKSDSILNVSALARYCGVARATFISRCERYGLESTIKHFLNEKRRKQCNT